MRRAFRSVWGVTAVALLGAMITGGGEARAAIGLDINGGFTPVTGDPPYDYIFQVYLNPGSTLYIGDSFTIDNLVGVTPFSSPTAKEPANWSPVPFVCLTSSSYPYASNVTWTYLGFWPQTNNGTQPKLIGQFEIETTVNFANGPPVPAGTSIFYSYSIDGGTVQASKSFAIADLTAVPEPSSSAIVLLISGTAAVSGLVVRARRRRSTPAA